MKKYRPSFKFWYKAYGQQKNPARFLKALSQWIF